MSLKTTGSPEQSRRSFFGSSVKLVGAGAVAATLGAQTTTPTTPSDVDLLNYALTLENIEAAFYVQGLTKLTAGDFAASSLLGALGSSVSSKVVDYLKIIRDDEVAHVSTITTVIKALGGTPVPACPSYNFTYTTADDFLRLAVTLEETGVAAYDGAIALIKTAELRTAAATIATVEARHAGYLNLLAGNIPFPNPFDPTKTQAEITTIITPFLSTGCLLPPVVTPPVPPPVVTKAVASPKSATVISSIALDGSTSVSFDGKPLTYLWKAAKGGKTAAIINANTVKPLVQFGEGFGYYNFELTVTDSKGDTAKDQSTIFYAGR
jgi:rubrerythrin